jgi:Acyl-CoA carboxylase epsilon subunit
MKPEAVIARPVPEPDELAAIIAVLSAMYVAGASKEQAANPSRWRLAARDYEAESV